MKLATLFLLAGLVLLFLTLRQGIHFTAKTVDISIHDTVFVTSYFSFIIFLLLFALSLFTLGGIIATGLRNKQFLWSFFIIMVLNGLFYWKYFTGFKS
jgi:hypothetical protein